MCKGGSEIVSTMSSCIKGIVFPCCVKDTTFLERHNFFGRRKKGLVLGIDSVMSVFWVIWMERNKRIFKNLKEYRVFVGKG